MTPELHKAWLEVLRCARIGSHYKIGTERRAYWDEKTKAAKEIKDRLKAAEEAKYRLKIQEKEA